MKTWRAGLVAVLALFWLGLAGAVRAERRFPPPDFESGYKPPAVQSPAPRSVWLEYVDVAVLVAALGWAAHQVYRKRSRRGVLGLTVFSLAYFGFYREGCICPIGSVQNVALALFNRGYALPVTVLAFFVAPLVATLFWGRTFCAAVCPHGALQDLVLVKPLKVPLWLEQGLGMLAYGFLGMAVWIAATGSDFVICRYDPFVPIFRRAGNMEMLLLGAGFVGVGLFVGRPYCRFFCPYGALLRLAAVVSKWCVRVTPRGCTRCGLCGEACPYGALRAPASPPARTGNLAAARRRLLGLLGLVPVLIIGGGWVGSRLSVAASRADPAVELAERFLVWPKAAASERPLTAAELSLRRAAEAPKEVVRTAVGIRRRFVVGGWILGGWLGLVFGARLLRLSVWPVQTDYEPDRGSCLACARCFEYCPEDAPGRVPADGGVPTAATGGGLAALGQSGSRKPMAASG